ncbi:MAG TPA: SIMPL domain-containing protein [Gaiellaceae bacterium]|nr:SIMPL domain-containing protein [Gaiellaceae bacterium]
MLLPLAVAVLVGIAAFAGVARPESAHGDSTQTDTVTTNGHGVITAVPDEAIVAAGVGTDGASAAAALSANAAKMNAVIAALKAASGDQIQTQEVSLYPTTDPQGKVTGYTAQNTVSAKAKIARAGALVDAAVGAGANTVDGPSLTLSDQDALYRDALKKAVSDARAKALALADAGGFGVGPVSTVVEQSAAGQPVFARPVALAAKDASTPIEPGTADVTADVTVTFTIR